MEREGQFDPSIDDRSHLRFYRSVFPARRNALGSIDPALVVCRILITEMLRQTDASRPALPQHQSSSGALRVHSLMGRACELVAGALCAGSHCCTGLACSPVLNYQSMALEARCVVTDASSLDATACYGHNDNCTYPRLFCNHTQDNCCPLKLMWHLLRAATEESRGVGGRGSGVGGSRCSHNSPRPACPPSHTASLRLRRRQE